MWSTNEYAQLAGVALVVLAVIGGNVKFGPGEFPPLSVVRSFLVGLLGVVLIALGHFKVLPDLNQGDAGNEESSDGSRVQNNGDGPTSNPNKSEPVKQSTGDNPQPPSISTVASITSGTNRAPPLWPNNQWTRALVLLPGTRPTKTLPMPSKWTILPNGNRALDYEITIDAQIWKVRELIQQDDSIVAQIVRYAGQNEFSKRDGTFSGDDAATVTSGCRGNNFQVLQNTLTRDFGVPQSFVDDPVAVETGTGELPDFCSQKDVSCKASSFSHKSHTFFSGTSGWKLELEADYQYLDRSITTTDDSGDLGTARNVCVLNLFLSHT